MLGVELSNLLGVELKTIQSRSYRDSLPQRSLPFRGLRVKTILLFCNLLL